jgi:hypothetical protein
MSPMTELGLQGASFCHHTENMLSVQKKTSDPLPHQLVTIIFKGNMHTWFLKIQ